MSAAITIPRILLTNDDGLDAPGLTLLREICAPLAKEIWVVAPDKDQSGTSQSLTLHRPIFSTQRAPQVWAVQGTPADCMALALHHFMKAQPPGLVIAGINAGANIGDEVNLSGTLGAAFTALMFGVPSIAVSQACVRRDQAQWETARAILPRILADLLSQGWRKETCLSINIPDLPAAAVKGYKWTRQSQKNVSGVMVETQISPRDEAYHWLKIARQPTQALLDSDDAALRQGMVAITALQGNRCIEIARQGESFQADEASLALEEV